MKLSELIEKMGLRPLTEEMDDRHLTGCYIGDLLSWVMGKAEPGHVWITIMSNVNIVAVATLTDCAAVLLAEGVMPEADVLEKANAQGVTVLSSEKSAYELSKEIYAHTAL